VLALPGRTLTRIRLCPRRSIRLTRPLLVRRTVDNKDGQLKPEMFANVTLYSPAITRPWAYQAGPDLRGQPGRVWVAHR